MTALPFPSLQTFHAQAALDRLSAQPLAGAPFQSAAWLSAWLVAHGSIQRFHLVELSAADGAWVLPLQEKKRAGFTVLTKVGGAHASFFTPLRAGQPAPLCQHDLDIMTRALKADALLLEDCPESWQGAQLFAQRGQTSPDIARGLPLSPETLAQSGRGEAAKKLRAKKRKLEALGLYTSGFAGPEETPEILRLMLGWKAEQFKALGIRDSFADAQLRDFLARGLQAFDPENSGGLRLYLCRLAGRPIAALLLAQSGGHASGMITAFDPTPDIARCGPGDVLVGDLIGALAQESVSGFDLGVGDARYKRLHAPEAIPLHDHHAAGSAAGAALVALHKGVRRAKGAIKQRAALLDRLRSARAMLRGEGSGA